MLKREWGAESNKKLSHLFIPRLTATLVPEFAVEDIPSVGQQPRFLYLQFRTCPWTEHSDDIYITNTVVIGRKPKNMDMRIKHESVEQVDSFKCLGSNISRNLNCCKEVKQRIAMSKEAFTRKGSILC